MASLLAATILNVNSLGGALSRNLARKLGDETLEAMSLGRIIDGVYEAVPSIVEMAEHDLNAIVERDPASAGYLKPFLFFKGFLGLQTHRIANVLQVTGRETLAAWLQSRSSALFHIDIHPAACIGRGVFIDHGVGVVIGETAIVGDRVSILQGVTLGGVGSNRGHRHPRIGNGVLLSADATVLGDISIGDDAKVAAGSVLLRSVPAGCTAVGVPARLVNRDPRAAPARTIDEGLVGHQLPG
ncbi:Serine acetyltransferase [Caulobacter sp. NIBR1757]|nr:Serine acetyltransferase [Caulobacter sp. NIBR1757]